MHHLLWFFKGQVAGRGVFKRYIHPTTSDPSPHKSRTNEKVTTFVIKDGKHIFQSYVSLHLIVSKIMSSKMKFVEMDFPPTYLYTSPCCVSQLQPITEYQIISWPHISLSPTQPSNHPRKGKQCHYMPISTSCIPKTAGWCQKHLQAIDSAMTSDWIIYQIQFSWMLGNISHQSGWIHSKAK